MAALEAGSHAVPAARKEGDGGVEDRRDSLTADAGLVALGYKPELRRNRTLYTILFQSIAIIAVPFGEGTALNSAIVGGGQLPYFVGWIVVSVLDEAVAMSLAELASRFPTSAGPYFWVFRLMHDGPARTALSFATGWIWLAGNWTIALSVNFGFASLLAGTATMYHPQWAAAPWQLLLIFYAVCLAVFAVCALANRLLPRIDTAAAICNAVCILVVAVGLSVAARAGRHSAADALAHYDASLSGWGGFSFFIGLLPAAYTFAALGMISSMAEEVDQPDYQLPRAMCLSVPIASAAGLFFILPICFTLPPLQDVLAAPAAQGLPYVFATVMGSPGGGLALMFWVLAVAAFCSVSITTAASRCTWAFARDRALPLARVWSRLSGGGGSGGGDDGNRDTNNHDNNNGNGGNGNGGNDNGDTNNHGNSNGTPVAALALTTLVQMLLGLINLGSTGAFTAFASVGVIGLAAAYALPVAVSVATGRRAVAQARFRLPPPIGWAANALTLLWIAFQLVLFSLPTALPATPASMNYAAAVFVGFIVLSSTYYAVWARKVYRGPPKSDAVE